MRGIPLGLGKPGGAGAVDRSPSLIFTDHECFERGLGITRPCLVEGLRRELWDHQGGRRSIGLGETILGSLGWDQARVVEFGQGLLELCASCLGLEEGREGGRHNILTQGTTNGVVEACTDGCARPDRSRGQQHEEEVEQPDGTIKMVRSGPTPKQTLRKALDDEVFDAVRLKLSELKEGPLKDYTFVKPSKDADGFELV